MSLRTVAGLLSRKLGSFGSAFAAVFKLSVSMLLVPGHTVLEPRSNPTENVKRASDRQVDLSSTQLLHQIQIPDVPAPTGVRDGDRPPLCQSGDELLVDALLQALVVGGVDQELAAVGLEHADVFCGTCWLVVARL